MLCSNYGSTPLCNTQTTMEQLPTTSQSKSKCSSYCSTAYNRCTITIRNHQQRPIIRAHIGGDFFNQSYFLAWCDLALAFAPTWFYSYTKRIDLWIANQNSIPSNFELNASWGGKHDHLITTHNLKSAQVVYSKQEAEKKGLEIDNDDSHAYTRGPSFAQLIHGTQPAGSEASKALTLLKLSGWTGYRPNTSCAS